MLNLIEKIKYFSVKESVIKLKFVSIFVVLFMIFGITIDKVRYLQGHKWLLSQNQRVRNNFFGYRRP